MIILINTLGTIINKAYSTDLLFFGCNFYNPDNSIKSFFLNDKTYNEDTQLEKGLYNLIVNSSYPDYLGFTWNKIFKKDIIEKYKIYFIKDLCYREDEIFTLEYSYYCKNIKTCSEIVYNYNISSNGLTNKKRNKNTYLLLAQAYYTLIKKYNTSEMVNYITLQYLRYTFDIIKKTYNTEERNAIISILWSKNAELSREVRNKLNVKHIYRFLLNLQDPIPLKLYMGIKLLFKHK